MICLAISIEYRRVTHRRTDIWRRHSLRYVQHRAVKNDGATPTKCFLQNCLCQTGCSNPCVVNTPMRLFVSTPRAKLTTANITTAREGSTRHVRRPAAGRVLLASSTADVLFPRPMSGKWKRRRSSYRRRRTNWPISLSTRLHRRVLHSSVLSRLGWD